MLMILSTSLRARHLPVLAGSHLRPVQAVRDGPEQDLVHERGLARAGDAGHAAEHSERELDVDLLQVVLLGAQDLDRSLSLAAAPPARGSAACRPGTGPVSDCETRFTFAGGPSATIWPPCSPAPGPRSTMWSAARIVPSSCSTTITVLPRSRSRVEHVEQLVVVALVQPDRGLVQDVEHAHEAGADLRREADPLRLAARQRGRRSFERQVPDAHRVQEPQPLDDLLQDPGRDLPLRIRQVEGVEPLDRLARGLARELVDADAADLHGQCLRPQPRAVAFRAWPHRHVLLDALARILGVGLQIPALEARHDALERSHVGPPPPHPVAVGDVHPLALGAVQEEILILLGEVLPRHVEVDAVLLADRLCELLVVVGPRAPGQDRALVDRQRRVHHEVRVDLHLGAEAGAPRTRAVRRVEREDPRLQLRHRRAAFQAGELLREDEGAGRFTDALRPGGMRLGVGFSAVDHLHLDEPLGQRHGGLDRVGQPLAHVRLHLEPVHDHRDVVLVLLVQLDVVLEPAQLAVDLHAGVALGAHLLEQVLVLALAPADHRRQHHEPGALVQRHHVVHDLLHRLPGDRRPAAVAVGVADPRPQQPQVVVDLGDRADRRPRVSGGRLLVDRDRRGQALDRIDVGLVHLAQELPRVGRQRLHVAALALGIDRVEGKARLTGPGEPGDDDQGVARQLEGDVLEIVLARTRDADAVIGGDTTILGRASTRPWNAGDVVDRGAPRLAAELADAGAATGVAPRTEEVAHEEVRDGWRP